MNLFILCEDVFCSNKDFQSFENLESLKNFFVLDELSLRGGVHQDLKVGAILKNSIETSDVSFLPSL